MTWLVYWLLWIIVGAFVPARKRHNGYIWRTLYKIPPWRLCRNRLDSMQRFLAFFMLLMPVYLLLIAFMGSKRGGILIYLVLIVVELDDYINGDDDDRKKRKEWVKNKVKWVKFSSAPVRPIKVNS